MKEREGCGEFFTSRLDSVFLMRQASRQTLDEEGTVFPNWQSFLV